MLFVGGGPTQRQSVGEVRGHRQHSSLHNPDKGLNELNEGLLALVAHLGARGRGLGLAGGQDAAGRR